MTLSIRTATSSDVDSVVALRMEAEGWLHAAGIHQWIDHARGVRSILAGIADGTTYVVTNPDDHVAATLTLSGPDLDFWTAEDEPDQATYLYKFIIGPSYRGTGLGDELLDWACAHAEECGKTWLRLDCWRDNHGLQSYYQRRGFKHVRTMHVPGRDSGALFQRSSATRTTTPHLTLKTPAGGPR